jgi:hypothetical protein
VSDGHVTLGKDKIRYLLFKKGRWRWRPTKTMREAGFTPVRLGPGLVIDGTRVPGPDDVARAMQLNHDWDRHRQGLPLLTPAGRYPSGSIGDGFERAVRLRALERTKKGVVWTKEQHSRDDWARVWKRLERMAPLLAECDPKTVTPELLLELCTEVADSVSASESHRLIKVWRALWKKMAAFGFCELDRDPSLLFANSAPAPRQAIWRKGEVVRLVKAAWREGYKGLAACMAVAWDSQLSPVDARSLKAGQLQRDPVGWYFKLGRAKTGRGALGTLSKRAERVLVAYTQAFGAEVVGDATIFRNRSGAPYSKDTLGDDFRDIRELVFGPHEKRQMADFRRTGSVEALAGGADPEGLSSKMANSLSQSNRLHKTYAPVQLAKVREVDVARKRGRTKLREQRSD